VPICMEFPYDDGLTTDYRGFRRERNLDVDTFKTDAKDGISQW
jgi:hypothetical protein